MVQMRVGGRYRLRNGEVWTCTSVDVPEKYTIEGGDEYVLVGRDGRRAAMQDHDHDVIAEVTDDATSEPQQVEAPSHPSRYHRQFQGVTLDLYRVANLWGVKSHALFHAMKKIMLAGNRGAKDYATDLREAIVAIEQELKMIEEGGAS